MMALAAATMLSSCSKHDETLEEGAKTKSLSFSLDVTKPSTKALGNTVDGAVFTAAFKAAITSVKIELYADATLKKTVTLTGADPLLAAIKAPTGKITLHELSFTPSKVVAIINETTETNINEMQDPLEMVYSGETTLITALGSTHAADGNEEFGCTVEVAPSQTRFEVKGSRPTITAGTNKPTDKPNASRAEVATAGYSEASIVAAEESAKAAWSAANSNAPFPVDGTLTYALTYIANTAYTITSIDKVFMNYIPVTEGTSLIKNANDGTGNWNAAGLESYTRTSGSLRNMWDSWNANGLTADQAYGYNLFPQLVTFGAGDDTDAKKLAKVKSSLPHVIIEMTTSIGKRYITVRAFKDKVVAEPFINSFDAGKLYILALDDIKIYQWTKRLIVKAGGTPGNPDDKEEDPTDPNPEPENIDLVIGLTVKNWIPVNMEPVL